MADYQVLIPDDFEHHLAELKGWYPLVKVIHDGKTYGMMFFDPTRLFQESVGQLNTHPVVFEMNLIIVQRISREANEAAIEYLLRVDKMKSFVPDESEEESTT